MLLYSQIADLSGAYSVSKNGPDSFIKHLLTDSRSLHFPEQSLFIAIKGKNHDGHQYIRTLYAQGVRQFVVEHEEGISEAIQKSSNVLKVTSGLRFLQSIVAYKRELFDIPVVAITGSNAKTIVKELLWQLLRNDFSIVRSPKSYNSQLGVPLSVWEMEPYHTLGIFEAGISQIGEMEHLQKVIAPTHGIFTNVGSAHDEGFQEQRIKIQEKLRLFYNVEKLIYCKDHRAIDEEVQAEEIKSFTWSRNDSSANVFVKHEVKHNGTYEADLICGHQSYKIKLGVSDEASIENILHAITFMILLGYSSDEISKRIDLLEPVQMRLELKNGTNGCVLIDDSYNNDLMGLTLALDFAEQHRRALPLTVILSDVLESGMPPRELYASIAQLLSVKKATKVVGIGKEMEAHRKFFPSSSEFFINTTQFLSQYEFSSFKNQLILIKGARTFGFEEITKHLEAKVHGTRFEVNLDALIHNLNYYRSIIKPGTKVMAMVKAFAYGSGSYEVAQLLQHQGVNYLAVAYADEGVDLRNHGITVPIMVMNPDRETFRNLIRYKLEPEIYSLKLLKEWLEFLEWEDASTKIHLKLETGMHRLGFEEEDLIDLFVLLGQNKHRVHLAGVFTHLAAADDGQWNEFTKSQLMRFEKLCGVIETTVGYSFLKHALNSAGIVRFPEYSFDMVRLGIGLYGVEANELHQEKLLTVGQLKTHISQIKQVQPDQTVGYGRKGKVNTPKTIATIAIGYADGFDRRFSNGAGKINVNGVLCPVIGNVCMDMTMVDITGVQAQEGDEVIVFGESPSIIEQAKAIGTISYELLTGVGERVKRVFFKN